MSAPLNFVRRSLLKGAATLGLAFPARVFAQSGPKPPAKRRPQRGDGLVFADGEGAGHRVTPSDVEEGAPPLRVLPIDAVAGVVRDGSRLNQLLLLRLSVESLLPEVADRGADGIVAFSAVCTHTGCDLSGWDAESASLVCPCHLSQFRTASGGSVVGGPAPKPLAMLPLSIIDGELMVAAGFTRRVGFQRP